MSTYYDFMLEAMYDGKWYNTDFLSQRVDGRLRHEYLECVSRSYLGYLDDFVHSAGTLPFEQLAESTQKLLLDDAFDGHEDYIRMDNYFIAGNIHDLESLLETPVPMEYYVTPTQIKAFESGKIDEFEEYLTAHELLELPAAARSEYQLYRWYDEPHGYKRLRNMVARAKEQLQCFTESIPYRNGEYGKVTDTRIIYRIS